MERFCKYDCYRKRKVFRSTYMNGQGGSCFYKGVAGCHLIYSENCFNLNAQENDIHGF